MKYLIVSLVLPLSFFASNLCAAPAKGKPAAKQAAPAKDVPPAKPMECVTRDGGRAMIFREGVKAKAAMIFQEGASEISCPYKRTKVEDKKPKTGRQIAAHYKKDGECTPKGLAGKAARSEFLLIVEWKDKTPVGRFEDLRIKAGAPCELADFRVQAFGLKK